MKPRTVKLLVLITFIVLLIITLYRFVDNLGQSYQQLG